MDSDNSNSDDEIPVKSSGRKYRIQSDSEEDTASTPKTNEESSARTETSGWNKICDSDSEAELPELEQKLEPVIYKSRRVKNDDEPKKMTVKEAAAQRQEIESESQKRVRETEVSLPYHRPKTYTLREFLQKRKKFNSVLDGFPKVSPAIALKMSKEKIEEVSKRLEDRMKDLVDFYRSESDEDDEEKDNSDAVEEARSYLDSVLDNVFKICPEEVVIEAKEAPLAVIPRALIPESLRDLTPKLSGGTDEVIDLETGATKPSDIKLFMDKFLNNAKRSTPPRHRVEFDVVGLNKGGEVITETISMSVDEEDTQTINEVPGAKLKKLQLELKEQIAERRLKFWREKQETGDVFVVEPEAKAEEKPVLDEEEEEEEAEFTDSDSSGDEEEGFLNEEAIEDEAGIDPPSPVSPPKRVLKRIKDVLDESEDEEPVQEPKKDDFEFLTPVTYITGLQNLNSEKKAAEASPTSTATETPSSERSQPVCQVNDTESLEDLCSGAFPSSTNLENLCSGVFPGGESTEPRIEEEDEFIISQLLDEAALERFKKKFESPLKVLESQATGVFDSDDEDAVKVKRTNKRLVFSDESDGDDSELEEENDADDDDDDDEDDEEAVMEKRLGAGLKASDFLEKEAELSESEWGSADEDEKGDDGWEAELGDSEKFNEKKLRRDLERIHVRQVLDEDNREVKLLQELLLEDGDLHGAGRKRQFRWKLLDSEENKEFARRSDDEGAGMEDEEEECEAKYRKMRHQREQFLQKKPVSDDLESIFSDSPILQKGLTLIKTKPKSESGGLALSKRGSFLNRPEQDLERIAAYNKIAADSASTVKLNSKSFVFHTLQPSAGGQEKKRRVLGGTPRAIKKLRLNDLSQVVTKVDGSFKK